MAVVAALSVTPLGGPAVADDGSVAPAVADVVRVVRESGLPNETNAMFTNVEGSLEEVLGLVARCIEAAARRAPRVTAVVKLDVREGHEGALREKVVAVEQLLGVPTTSSAPSA